MVAVSSIPLTPAQQSLAESCRKLATFVVNRYFRSYKAEAVLWDALHGAAAIGLINAAARYKPGFRSPRSGCPVKFVTFATHTIWGTCRKQITQYHRKPDRLRMPLHERQLGGALLSDLTPIECDPSISAENSERAALVADALRFLHPVELTVIRLRFGLNGSPQMELSEVARQLGVSRERACQRYRSALVKLRNEIPCAALRKALVA